MDGQEDEAGCLLIGQSASIIYVVYSGAPRAEGVRAKHHGKENMATQVCEKFGFALRTTVRQNASLRV